MISELYLPVAQYGTGVALAASTMADVARATRTAERSVDTGPITSSLAESDYHAPACRSREFQRSQRFLNSYQRRGAGADRTLEPQAMGGAPCGNTVLTPTHVVPTLAFRWLGESSARCRATVPSDGSRFAGPGAVISLHVSASLFRCPPRTGHATESTAALSEALTLWYQDRSGGAVLRLCAYDMRSKI